MTSARHAKISHARIRVKIPAARHGLNLEYFRPSEWNVGFLEALLRFGNLQGKLECKWHGWIGEIVGMVSGLGRGQSSTGEGQRFQICKSRILRYPHIYKHMDDLSGIRNGRADMLMNTRLGMLVLPLSCLV
jgi:hypothetical protein